VVTSLTPPSAVFDPGEVNTELIGWIRVAYDSAG
jgi:hypothetical protein